MDKDIACIEEVYGYLDENNGEEILIALTMIWNNFAWVAIFGPLIFLQSFLCIFEGHIWPMTKPDLRTKWSELHEMDLLYLEWVLFVASIGEPFLFIIMQIATLG